MEGLLHRDDMVLDCKCAEDDKVKVNLYVHVFGGSYSGPGGREMQLNIQKDGARAWTLSLKGDDFEAYRHRFTNGFDVS
ncbi:hypothetical protein Tco_0478955 [Tanacetum coccineum]